MHSLQLFPMPISPSRRQRWQTGIAVLLRRYRIRIAATLVGMGVAAELFFSCAIQANTIDAHFGCFDPWTAQSSCVAMNNLSHTSQACGAIGRPLRKSDEFGQSDPIGYGETNHGTTVTHFFPLPRADPRWPQPALCMPQKNGNRNFGGLVYAAWRCKPPQSTDAAFEGVKPFKRYFASAGNRYDHIDLHDRNTEVYLISRNPYARLLSLFLEKVEGNCIAASGLKVGCGDGRFLGLGPSTTFSQFVQHVWNRTGGVPSRLCGVNHHLCQQLDVCVATLHGIDEVRVLKLEEQSRWFPCFVQRVGLNADLLNGAEWTPFAGRECYYTATGACEANTADEAVDYVVTGHTHATGASRPSTMQQHYDAPTAQLVSSLYALDLRALEYAVWDGHGSWEA